jgi:hypothetical protein
MTPTCPAEKMAERARDWAASDGRVAAAFIYGSVAKGQADEWSDLDLLVVAEVGARERLWAGRAELAARILGDGGVVWDGELGHQRPYRYAAYRGDAAQLDLTVDEGNAQPWRGLADGFVTIADRYALAERLRSELDGWRPPEPAAARDLGGAWLWLKYLAGRLRRGQVWMVRCGLSSFAYERILPLLGVSPNAMESVLTEIQQRRLHAALPTSDETGELARSLRATAELYGEALTEWARRTGNERPEHPLAATILARIKGL